MDSNLMITVGVGTLLSSLAILLSLREIHYWHASKSWPSTLGTIIKAKLKKKKKSNIHKAKIRFEYSVNGVSYQASTIRIGGIVWSSSAGRGQAEEFLAKYPVGAKVSVLYNPHRPSYGALERGENYRGSIFGLAIGLIILAAALSVFLTN